MLVLPTKLTLPTLPSQLVKREALIQRLDGDETTKLTLLSAPAGYGKTTLIRQWIEESDIESIWYSLDNSDNNPNHFIRHLLASLIQVNQDLTDPFESLMEDAFSRPETEVIAELIHVLSKVDTRYRLILDNFHEISSAVISSFMAALIKYLPPQFHLIILTRSDPQFSLSRMRADRQVVEIRVPDLAFSEVETQQFLQLTCDLDLSSSQIKEIQAKAEGWPVALHMAVLTIQSNLVAIEPEKPVPLVNRFILDYVQDEILHQVTSSIRLFLLQTAFLKQFNNALCQILMDGKESDEILTELAQSNQFLKSIDHKNQWFHYHPLFADLLCCLSQTASPKRVTAVHRKAAVWFADAKQYDTAFYHAFETDDMDFVADLLEDHLIHLIPDYQVNISLQWINRIPENNRRGRFFIELVQTLVLFFREGLTNIEETLAHISTELSLHIDRYCQEKQTLIRGIFSVLECFCELHKGQFDRSIELGKAFQTEFPNLGYGLREAMLYFLAASYWAKGEILECNKIAMIGLDRIESNGEIYSLTLELLTIQAEAERLRGSLINSEEVLRAADTVRKSDRYLKGLYFFSTHLKRAVVFFNQNNLDKALKLVSHCIADAESSSRYGLLSRAYAFKALIYQLLGDSRKSVQFINKARWFARRTNSKLRETEVELIEMETALKRGNLPVVIKWLNSKDLDDKKPFSHNFEIECLIAANCFQVRKQFREALNLMEKLRPRSLKRGRLESVLKIDIISAACQWALKDQETALDTLEEAIEFAHNEGYLRPFLDQATNIRDMLLLLVKKGDKDRRSFIRDLIKYSDKEINVVGLIPKVAVSAIDTLTSRELQILQLMSSGISNREIAEMNFIELSTVKSHVKSIYRKLNVRTRDEVISRAQKQEFFPPPSISFPLDEVPPSG